MSTNRYTPHPLMIDSGTFWRCRHGRTHAMHCWRCGIWHPVRFVRAALADLWRKMR